MNIFIFILVVHWITDFIFQSEKWSMGKSKSFLMLIKHTSVYASLWLLPVWLMTYELIHSLTFVLATFITHTLIDYFSSKIVSAKFARGYYTGPIPNFGAFTIIGFDQLLHYLQLIYTWQFCFN